MKLPHKHSKGELNMSKPIIQLNEENVKSELKELVRSSVEETLNELLNKEADADERGGAQETLLGRALKFGFVGEALCGGCRGRSPPHKKPKGGGVGGGNAL